MVSGRREGKNKGNCNDGDSDSASQNDERWWVVRMTDVGGESE
jgi:hypothetical protein